MWGIIGAMDSEISLLRTQMQQEQEIRRGNKVFYRGYIEEQPVIVTKSGMGKVNAAMCAQMLIDLFGVDHLVNTGIAGGIAAGLHVGDVVIGSAAVQHDFDLTPVGYVRGHIAGPDREKPTLFAADAELAEHLRRAAEQELSADKVHVGCIATGDQFVNQREVKRQLRERYGAYAAEMEGGAIAQVAEENGIAAVILRCISDLADEGSQESVENFEQLAADTSARILVRMLANCRAEDGEAETVFVAITQQARQAAEELVDTARLEEGDILVVGCSTSEAAGHKIGSYSNKKLAEAIFDGLYPVLRSRGIYLAAQCCEHLNRSLVLEKEAAKRYGYDRVNVIPQPKAGGSFATTAYERFTSPVMVEKVRARAGMDIGGTMVGMHLAEVAVPVRLRVNKIGEANLICARVRAKFVGGSRAIYDETLL